MACVVCRGITKSKWYSKRVICDVCWMNIKTAVMEEKGYKCGKCGFDNRLALEMHHIDCDSKNNSLDNLIPLCCNCHRIWHMTNPNVGKTPCSIKWFFIHQDRFVGIKISKYSFKSPILDRWPPKPIVEFLRLVDLFVVGLGPRPLGYPTHKPWPPRV